MWSPESVPLICAAPGRLRTDYDARASVWRWCPRIDRSSIGSAYGDVCLAGDKVRAAVIDEGDYRIRPWRELLADRVDQTFPGALDQHPLRECDPVDDRSTLFDLDPAAQIDVRFPGVVEVDEVVLTVAQRLRLHVVDLPADVRGLRYHDVDLRGYPLHDRQSAAFASRPRREEHEASVLAAVAGRNVDREPYLGERPRLDVELARIDRNVFPERERRFAGGRERVVSGRPHREVRERCHDVNRGAARVTDRDRERLGLAGLRLQLVLGRRDVDGDIRRRGSGEREPDGRARSEGSNQTQGAHHSFTLGRSGRRIQS